VFELKHKETKYTNTKTVKRQIGSKA